MISGIYIGKSNQPGYDLVSTGDFLNPISPVFRLKDTQSTLEEYYTLYLIISDIVVNFIKVEVLGKMTMIRCFVSWDNKTWLPEISLYEEINANNIVLTRPFYVKFTVDDFLDYFKLSSTSTYTTYKLRLIYS